MQPYSSAYFTADASIPQPWSAAFLPTKIISFNSGLHSPEYIYGVVPGTVLNCIDVLSQFVARSPFAVPQSVSLAGGGCGVGYSGYLGTVQCIHNISMAY